MTLKRVMPFQRVAASVAALSFCLFGALLVGPFAGARAQDDLKDVLEAPAGAEAQAAANVEEPADYRTDGYRMPVPKTLAGAKVIATVDAEKLHGAGKAAFVDVYPRAPKPPNLPAGTLWRDPPHLTVPGAVWLPNVGYGVLPPETETAYKAQLEKISSGDRAKTMVFYCLRNCWMSWNAAKRAVSYGYTGVTWFPDGNDGWQEAGNELENVKPLP